MKITDRAYINSDVEFEEMHALLIESYSITGEIHNWLFARLEDWRYGGNSKKAKDDPSFFVRNARLWRDEDGTLVGFCISESGGDGIEVQIHPAYRSIEEDMFSWALNAWAGDREQVVTYAFEYDEERQRVLAKLGFEDQGSTGYMRKYDLSREYAPVELEDGFSIERLAENGNLDSRVEATASAFERPSLDREWFDTKITAPGYSSDWDFSVISPAGKHVAFCLAWIDLNNRVAEIDPVGTHADYRQRGFAKAVVSECFRQLRGVGLDYAYIGSGPEPYVSNRLYESLHPVAKFQINMWVKRLE